MSKGPGSDHEHLDALRAYGLTYAEGKSLHWSRIKRSCILIGLQK